jgi:hypothetical protein
VKPDANGELTCNVCGEAWPSHGVGGNCKAIKSNSLDGNPIIRTEEVAR